MENCRIMERKLEFTGWKTNRKPWILRSENASKCSKNAAFCNVNRSFSKRVNATFLAVSSKQLGSRSSTMSVFIRLQKKVLCSKGCYTEKAKRRFLMKQKMKSGFLRLLRNQENKVQVRFLMMVAMLPGNRCAVHFARPK